MWHGTYQVRYQNEFTKQSKIFVWMVPILSWCITTRQIRYFPSGQNIHVIQFKIITKLNKTWNLLWFYSQPLIWEETKSGGKKIRVTRVGCSVDKMKWFTNFNHLQTTLLSFGLRNPLPCNSHFLIFSSCYFLLLEFSCICSVSGVENSSKQINIMAAAFAGTQQKCMACDKTVYLVDKLTADNRIYHKACFRCHHCKGTLKAFINFDPLFFILITSILPLMNDLGLLVRFCGYQTCLN